MHCSHDDLLQTNGIYANLWRKQAGFTLSETGDHAAVELQRLRDFPILSLLDETILAKLRNQFVTGPL